MATYQGLPGCRATVTITDALQNAHTYSMKLHEYGVTRPGHDITSGVDHFRRFVAAGPMTIELTGAPSPIVSPEDFHHVPQAALAKECNEHAETRRRLAEALDDKKKVEAERDNLREGRDYWRESCRKEEVKRDETVVNLKRTEAELVAERQRADRWNAYAIERCNANVALSEQLKKAEADLAEAKAKNGTAADVAIVVRNVRAWVADGMKPDAIGLFCPRYSQSHELATLFCEKYVNLDELDASIILAAHRARDEAEKARDAAIAGKTASSAALDNLAAMLDAAQKERDAARSALAAANTDAHNAKADATKGLKGFERIREWAKAGFPYEMCDKHIEFNGPEYWAAFAVREHIQRRDGTRAELTKVLQDNAAKLDKISATLAL